MKPKNSSIIWLFCLLLTAGCKDGNNITNEPSGPAPVIADISPERGKSGTEVTITGSNFGTAPEENTVTFNGKEAVVTGAGETELTAVVPPEAGSGPVTVNVAGQTSEGPEFTWFPDNTRFVDGVNGSDQGGDNQCGDIEFPCRSLSHTIEVSFGGDILEIADAEYTESLTIDRPLTLRGESEAGTIIQAHAQPGMATERVITISGDIEVAVSDLTIRHGNATGDAPNNQGGGIYNNDAMLTVTDVIFTDNSAGHGGGIYNRDGSPALTNVIFSGNVASGSGGGMFNLAGDPQLTDVTFTDNLAEVFNGGGMFNFESSPALTNVTFERNEAVRGGGMFNLGGNASPELTNVTFRANTALFGGGMFNFENASPTLTNVIFTGNTANRLGGGMFVENSSLTLKNVLFFGNESLDGAGGLVCSVNCTTSLMNVTIRSNNAENGNGGGLMVEEDSELILRNTIVWGNFADNFGDEIYTDDSSETRLFYSLYNDGSSLDIGGQGTFTTENSLTVDPLFVDLNEGNLRLQAGSPAIDAGDPDTDPDIFPDGVDLDGNPRIAGGRIDMGVYEHQEN